jgi:hypothetical protein
MIRYANHGGEMEKITVILEFDLDVMRAIEPGRQRQALELELRAVMQDVMELLPAGIA